jgi:hypothetical protein
LTKENIELKQRDKTEDINTIKKEIEVTKSELDNITNENKLLQEKIKTIKDKK